MKLQIYISSTNNLKFSCVSILLLQRGTKISSDFFYILTPYKSSSYSDLLTLGDLYIYQHSELNTAFPSKMFGLATSDKL